MDIGVATGIVLALLGGGLVSLKSQLEVRRSWRPKARRYVPGFLLLTAGLVDIVWVARCSHLSAWMIGIVWFLFTLATPIAMASWGHLIPELKWVVVALGAVAVLVVVIGFLRPGC